MRYGIFSHGDKGIMRIDSIGYSGDTSVTRFGPAKRNQYIIHYVISGKGYFNGNAVHGGEGFLIRPGTAEHYYPDDGEPWEFIWVISCDEKMSMFFDDCGADADTGIFSFGNTEVLEETKGRLLSIAPGSPDCFRTPSEMLECFLHIFNTRNISKRHTETAADLYFGCAVSYIDSNLFANPSVSELTSLLGISQPYLYRIFLEKCNMSPKKYIDSRKAAQARRLLSETDMTVTEIAGSMGYGDVTEFSKFFKRCTGISPRFFRTK